MAADSVAVKAPPTTPTTTMMMAASAQMTLDNYKQYYQFSFGDAISFDDYNLTAYHYDKAAEFVKKNAKIKK